MGCTDGHASPIHLPSHEARALELATDLESKTEELMLAAIGAVVLVLWLLGFFAFHVTAGAVHILLLVALVLLVMHFVTGRGAAV
jgi:hypothetical protein